MFIRHDRKIFWLDSRIEWYDDPQSRTRVFINNRTKAVVTDIGLFSLSNYDPEEWDRVLNDLRGGGYLHNYKAHVDDMQNLDYTDIDE